MTQKIRKAGVIWTGDSQTGGGIISTESRVLYEQPYNYATRFEDAEGTNPEELLAAAHGACYSMAVASALKEIRFMPRQTETNAECTVASKNGGYEITHMQLHVGAEAAGIDDATFQKLVHEAASRSI